MLTSLLLAALMQTASPGQDDVVVTGNRRPLESVADVRTREALAYEAPLPRGAPEADYPFVAWCEALVTGHVKLGETLTNDDPLDREIMRLGRLEAVDFRSALAEASARQTSAVREAARRAADDATAMFAPLMAQEDEKVRSQAFGLFFGLPGRCEHAARRIRANITTPPATLAEAGLDADGRPTAP
ncbi:hypothetical protein ACO2Q1_07645 [Brevundimonas sp. VNH65]|uniref:hypothetical protein n=1 Tax=Brevundimonas sp. VNH65 TaxID=3400917 RepID=UPI003C048775